MIEKTKIAGTSVTLRGRFLFLTGLGLAGSASETWRLVILGLRAHPYLFVLLPAAIIYGVRGIARRENEVWRNWLTFVIAFSVSHVVGPWDLGQVVKLTTFLATVAATAVLARTDQDVKAGMIGLFLGVALLAAKGFDDVAAEGARLGVGINPFGNMGNKNLLSMYTAPAVFGAGALLMTSRLRRVESVLLFGAGALMVAATFGSANRSGWLTMAVIPILLVRDVRRSWRLVPFLLISIVAVNTALRQFDLMPVVDQRLILSREGYSSDEVRGDIYIQGAKIFLESPLLGTFIPRLDGELGTRLLADGMASIGPHSVIVLLLAGGGLVVAMPFALTLRSMWMLSIKDAPASASWGWILRRLLILWVVRGLFSDEVLYAPAFAILMGLLVGRLGADENGCVSGTRVAGVSGAQVPSRDEVRTPGRLGHTPHLVGCAELLPTSPPGHISLPASDASAGLDASRVLDGIGIIGPPRPFP
ncbi:MAG: O-antigen ligase family protein [Acidobacteria bacterium]|nr:O-antigen ligase family protein [Acidobacteriota bacterium]